MIAWTRVHAITAVPPAYNAPRAATRPAKQKPCGNIVPHRENRGKECASIGERIPLLIFFFLPLNPATCVAPHGRPRGRVASLPLGAPYAPLARATRALPRGLSAASQPRLVPRATSLCPVRHVSRRLGSVATSPAGT